MFPIISMPNHRTKRQRTVEELDSQDFTPSPESQDDQAMRQRYLYSYCIVLELLIDYFVCDIRLMEAYSGETQGWILTRTTNIVTEMQRKEEIKKRSVKEKEFLEVVEKHLNRDVHDAHIYSPFTVANPSIVL